MSVAAISPAWAAAGMLVGVLLTALLLRARAATAAATARAAFELEAATLRERLRATADANADLQRELAAARDLAGTLRIENAQVRAHMEQERRHNQQQLDLLHEARTALGLQFRQLATEIFDEKSRRFAEQSRTDLGQLLDPLRQRIGEFQARVEDVYVKEGKDRSALAEQVRQLHALNQALGREARDLTQALKGSAKAQGNWGELVLERVLEMSGLRKGEEYDVQESHQREDGSRAQPDVVIHLPEDRHLVIDAKVTLTAYEEYASAESDALRDGALRRHVDSVRNHIRGLSARSYQDLYGLRSLDFVLMFIPIEPAFMLATANDRELFLHAWQRNVLLVSPSTLLFVVRTVAHLWRQEAQNRNAQDIAKRGAELYDKLAGFVESLDGVGNRLRQAQDEFDTARKRLAGKGGALRQAEMLRELGVKPARALALPDE